MIMFGPGFLHSLAKAMQIVGRLQSMTVSRRFQRLSPSLQLSEVLWLVFSCWADNGALFLIGHTANVKQSSTVTPSFWMASPISGHCQLLHSGSSIVS